jgi:hypothetical protein
MKNFKVFEQFFVVLSSAALQKRQTEKNAIENRK